MGKIVRFDVDGFRTGAAGFEACAKRTESITNRLRSAMESRGVCWGDDKAGHDFADGPKGYLAGRDAQIGSLDTNTKRMSEQATEMGKAVKALTSSEQTNTKSFT
ncbi:hypothetical protein [Nocardia altamirensis]|uniref:hypothetical protein n=1 Tax=Nocardia altamirensis TaxID=472158 RepID=UPI0008404896|nr:hypothetical protein [Nocardia altamirensis]